ncbi:MAG: hypothetical protein OSA48_04855 [Akkermansiaceae bacterium]|nr:hypothetical protein [Akkermansiaceae bacterium]
MPHRIEPDSISHGNVCNREKGITVVTLELADGRTVTAELQGNPSRDMAGRILSFRHPSPNREEHVHDSLSLQHHGHTGDITASLKVKVPTIPLSEIFENPKYKGANFPYTWKNSLYLEWYSRENGRVVLEASDFELTLTEPAWEITEPEELEAREQATQALTRFLNQLCDIIPEREDNKKLFQGKDVLNEHDHEKDLRFSDRMNDRYGELIDKFGIEADDKIDAHMGWDNPEKFEGGTNLDTPAPDWTPPEDDFELPDEHPLIAEAKILLDDFTPRHDGSEQEQETFFAVSMVRAKLSGALSGWNGEGFDDHGFAIACLKRVLGYIDTAVALADGTLTTNLLTLRQQIIDIQQQLRGS